MSSSLVSILHQEERSIIVELRASKPFQRLEAIRRLLALYDAQPSVATGLDGSGEAARGSGDVIHFAASAGGAQATAQPVAVAAPPAAASVAAIAEAAVADAAVRTPTLAPSESGETSGVVSSVRAALLGIGKH